MCQCIRSCTRRAQHLVGSREADGTATPFPLFVERLTSAFGAVSVHAPIGPLQLEEAAIVTAATMERDGQGVDIPSVRPKKDAARKAAKAAAKLLAVCASSSSSSSSSAS